MEVRQTAIVAVVIAAILCVAGCVVVLNNDGNNNRGGGSGGDDSEYYPVTIKTKNTAGEMVEETFTKCPEKVIVLWSSTVEVLLYFGLEDKIVGAFADANDTIAHTELQDKYNKVNFLGESVSQEVALMQSPDLIIGWSSSFSGSGSWSIGTTDYWNGINVGTYVFNSPNANMDDYCDHINNLGIIFNIKEKTDAYISQLTNDINEVKDKTVGINKEDKPTFLTLMFSDGKILSAYGTNNVSGLMGEYAGGVNLVQGATIKSPSNEDIIGMNPDYIIIWIGDFAHYISHEEALNDFKSLAGFNALDSKYIVYDFNQMYFGCLIDADIISSIYQGFYGS